MSRDEILSSFSFVIIGGAETSATTMTGIFNHLAMPQNKAVLNRLTKEIRSAYISEDEITVESITRAKLPYLDAVIDEGLRICHPVPSGLPRMVPPGGDEYAGIWLPGGVSICSTILYHYMLISYTLFSD
jgi:cytochrome P450